MARPRQPERNRTARSFGQLRRFHHVINSDKVFGTYGVAIFKTLRFLRTKETRRSGAGAGVLLTRRRRSCEQLTFVQLRGSRREAPMASTTTWRLPGAPAGA